MKCQDLNPFHCYFICQKSHVDCPAIEPGPSHCEASDQQPEIQVINFKRYQPKRDCGLLYVYASIFQQTNGKQAQGQDANPWPYNTKQDCIPGLCDIPVTGINQYYVAHSSVSHCTKFYHIVLCW